MGANLNELERDAEAARAKLASNLAFLRSPEIFAEFRSDLKQTASEIKTDVEDRGRQIATDLIDSLKAKAAANPLAVLSIGAGLLWHFARRPPITTALVGLGLFNLLRTPTPSNGRGEGLLQEAGDNLLRQAGDALDTVGSAGARAADTVRRKAGELAGEAGEALADMSQTAGDRMREGLQAAQTRAADLASRSAAAAGAAIEGVREQAAGMVSAVSSGDGGNGRAAAQYGAGIDNDGPLYFGQEEPLYYEQDEEEHAPKVSVDTLLLGGAGLAVAATCAAVLLKRRTPEHRAS